jgi:ZIP family zinc transporter
VVGSVVDGVPQSIILGMQITASLPISAALVAAVLVSNIPQSLAPSADLAAGGLLTMLTNSLMPFAYDRGGDLAGVTTVVGF